MPNGTNSTAVSMCNETSNGWYHNINESQWGCYYAQKVAGHVSMAVLIISVDAFAWLRVIVIVLIVYAHVFIYLPSCIHFRFLVFS